MMDDDTAGFERKALHSKDSHPNIFGAFVLHRIEGLKTNQPKNPTQKHRTIFNVFLCQQGSFATTWINMRTESLFRNSWESE